MSAKSWIISLLDVKPHEGGLENVVDTVHWRRVAADGTNTVDSYGSQHIGPAGDVFIPFEQLTPADVEAWLVEAIGADGLAAIDANLDDSLQMLAAPPIVTVAPPWVSA